MCIFILMCVCMGIIICVCVFVNVCVCVFVNVCVCVLMCVCVYSAGSADIKSEYILEETPSPLSGVFVYVLISLSL